MNQQSIRNVRWHHEKIIDFILMCPPDMTQNEIAREIGFSATWLSIQMNSDAFKERLAEKRALLTDPKIAASINERLEGLAKASLDRLIDRVDNPAPMKTLELVAIAKLAVGDKNTRPANPVQQNNLYVVAMPTPAKNSTEWISGVQGRKMISLENIEPKAHDASLTQPRGPKIEVELSVQPEEVFLNLPDPQAEVFFSGFLENES